MFIVRGRCIRNLVYLCISSICYLLLPLLAICVVLPGPLAEENAVCRQREAHVWGASLVYACFMFSLLCRPHPGRLTAYPQAPGPVLLVAYLQPIGILYHSCSGSQQDMPRWSLTGRNMLQSPLGALYKHMRGSSNIGSHVYLTRPEGRLPHFSSSVPGHRLCLP